jgi:hypothetical protein
VKVLFLDFDGVLNDATFLGRLADRGLIIVDGEWDWRDHIDPERLTILNRVLDETGAKVVVSSSWRCRYPAEELQRMLVELGFTGQIVGDTPRLFGHDRYVEIRRWLTWAYPPPVAFAIVDDDPDAGVGFERQFVRTSGGPGGGLRDEHAERLIAILGRSI